jgi:cation diffusion facilitator CzcD-associated flavoprotein CzcO
MLKQIEGSRAVAEAVAMCRPQVICAYPITPQTAAFVAVGAHIGKRGYIPAGDSARVMDAVSLLHSVEDGEPPMLGRRVAVYGGGNTAMDAARTARRLGAAEAVVVYRRTRDRMPAHDIEVEEALEEGVTMRWLSTVAHADEGTMTIERCGSTTPGSRGCRKNRRDGVRRRGHLDGQAANLRAGTRHRPPCPPHPGRRSRPRPPRLPASRPGCL